MQNIFNAFHFELLTLSQDNVPICVENLQNIYKEDSSGNFPS